MRLQNLICFLELVYGQRYSRIRSANIVAADGFGGAQIRLTGNFKSATDPSVNLVTKDDKYQCDVKHVTETYLICNADNLIQSYYTVELSYTNKNNVERETSCQSAECSMFIPVPHASMESTKRPRPRVEDGRRKPGYREPLSANDTPNTRGDDDNYPIIYATTYNEVNPNGGALVTIEGANFGSVLSSFGEEGREGNSKIEIYFEPLSYHGDEKIATYCHEIAHYHNPTQLFCILDRLSKGEDSYVLTVKINGHKATSHCGGYNWKCRIQAYAYKTMKIHNIRPGNLISPSVPRWTEWYSYDGWSSWTNLWVVPKVRRHHLWGDVYQTMSDFNNTYICHAPIAVEGRNKATLQTVAASFFDIFTVNQVTCALSAPNEVPSCNITEFEFRYLCDRSTLRVEVENDIQSLKQDPTKDGILGIGAETDDHQIAASCSQAYINENGESYSLDLIIGADKVNPNEHVNGLSTNDAQVFCRFDNKRVGHYHFNFKTMSMGRATLPWEAEYFDPEGKCVSITLAPAVEAIEPTIGSSEGGTLMTIHGQAFYQSSHLTEVMVGGDPCMIQSINDNTIICLTTKPTYNIKESKSFPGGAGAKTYFHNMNSKSTKGKPSWQSYLNEDAVNTRLTSRVNIEWGVYNWGFHKSYYVAKTEAAFVPPVSGYYTIVKVNDDHGNLYMDVNGTMDPTDRQSVVNPAWSSLGQWGPEDSKSLSKKMYFEGGKYYPFEDFYGQWTGRHWGQLGLIYHGRSEVYNMMHEPVTDTFEWYGWQSDNERLQIVTESQLNRVASTVRHEKHKILVTSSADTMDDIRFSLRWSNSNGQTKDTPMGTYSQLYANNGIRFQSLLETQCSTVGSMQVVAESGFEANSWRHSSEESYCGKQSAHHRWQHVFYLNHNTDVGQYTRQVIADATHLCFAHFGTLDAGAELRIYTGWMGPGSNTTFGTIEENLKWSWIRFSAAHISGLQSSAQWEHTCINIENLIREHLNETGDQNPDFVNHIYIESIYTSRTWGWFDAVQLGVASPDYAIVRDVSAHRPNTKIVKMDVGLNNHDLEIELEMIATGCGVDIPEMTVIPEQGATVTVTDVNLWDEEGNDVVGKAYELTNGNNDKVVIQIHEYQKVSPGVSGEFRFDYKGIKTPIMNFGTAGLATLAAAQIQKLHLDVATAEIEIDGNCNAGWTFNLEWGQQGDFEMVKLEDVNITGLNINIESQEYRSGGVLVRNLPGAYMATLHDLPQVQVKRNGILATCNTVDCNFEFKKPGTVIDITPTNFGALTNSNSISLSGKKLSNVVRVVIGGMDCVVGGIQCTIISTAENSVDVSFIALPYGTLSVQVYTDHGLAVNQNDQQITVAAQPVTISPSIGVLHGGNLVTLTGVGVGLGNNQVTIGGVVADTISRSTNEMIIMTPAGAALGDAQVGFASAVVLGTFTYDNSNAVTITLSKNDFSVLGEQGITITFSQVLTKHIQIFIENEIFGEYDLVSQDTLDISTPPHAAGKGLKFKVHVKDLGFTNSLNVRYRLTVSNVSPSASSTSGGALLTITGKGFGLDRNIVEVAVGGKICHIESLTNKKITCQTSAYYKVHDVYLTGESWYPQIVTVNQNDILRWQWVTSESVNVKIRSVDNMSNITGNGIFAMPLVAGNMGSITRVMKESPGRYFVSSGYMDAMYSMFANGEIIVNQAIDYEEDVSVTVGGFEAMAELAFKNGDKSKRLAKACGPLETDIAGKDPSSVVTTECLTCLKHIYSFQRTPVASNAVLLDGRLTISSPSIADYDGCPQDFTVKAWSATGEVNFIVDSVDGNTLTATMENPSDDWPFGVTLDVRVVESNRGILQIDANVQRSMTVDATVTSISPLRGPVLGGGIMTITGSGLYSKRYKTLRVSACQKILSHTSTEIICRILQNKPRPMEVVLSYFIAEGSDNGLIIGLIGPGGMIGKGRADYQINTGNTFSWERFDVQNEDDYFDDLDFHYSGDFNIPEPINLTAYYVQAGFPNFSGILATYVPTSAGSGYTISLTLSNTTTNNYDVYFKTNNYGIVNVGTYGRGVTILGSQDQGGSRGGGHTLLLSTTRHDGQIPTDHTVRFRIQGNDLCLSAENAQIPYMCQFKAVGTNQMTLTTPSIQQPGDSVQVYIEFRNLQNFWGPSMIQCAGCRYNYLQSLTPTLNSLNSYAVSVGDSLTATLDALIGPEGSVNDCNSIQMYLGEIECPVTTCDNNAGTVTCTVPGQSDGEYRVRVTFARIGDAVHADSTGLFVKMIFAVSDITPLTGSYGGGTEITITGTGFGPESFDGRICGSPLADCQFNGDGSQVICDTPEVDTDQVCSFVFFGTDGDPHDLGSRTPFNFNFDASQTPVITGIEPNMGGSLGGTMVTIQGTGFVAGSSSIMIGSTACVIKKEAPKKIVCETDAHPTSTKHRVILSVAGQGNAAAPDVDNRDFWYIDRWSSHFTWGCNDTTVPCPNKPVADDIAVIPAGKTVLLDESTPILSVLLIQGGTLLWAHQDGIKLSAQYILITDNGHFEAGTPTQPLCGADPNNLINADIELFGHHRSIKLPIYGAKVFAVRNGTIDIHGCPIGKTWTVISQTAEAGSNTIVVKDSIYDPAAPMTSWKVNDTIVIATTGGRLTMRQNEKRQISAISEDGFSITLDEPLTHKHIYHKSTWDGEELEITAEVGLLTRNVRFYGNRNDEWTETLPPCPTAFDAQEGTTQTCYRNKWGDEVASDEFGAHLIMHYIQRGRISHIETFHSGQGFQLGRYPLHFHNSGNQPDSYISFNAIHDTFNRAITMHGVWNATVEWNVAYNCMGHNFFIEDAVEEDLIIQYNLAVHTKPSFSLLNSDQKATAFWITNTYNTIQHNHAAGGAQVGFWVNPPEESGHANADCPPIVRSHCPVYTPVKKFYNNTAHDMGLYGLWVFSLTEESYYRPSTADCMPTWPPGEGTFERGIFWNNLRGAEMAIVGHNVWFKDFIVAHNALGGLSIMETISDRYGGEYGEYASGIKDSLVIGYVDENIPELSECTRFGVETPWRDDGYMVTEGIKFFNFDKNGTTFNNDFFTDGCTAIDACYSSYPFDCGRTSHWEQVEYFNTTRKFAADWEHETVLVDRDGSLTGTNKPGYSIVPKSALYPSSMCVDAPEFSIEFPSMLCNSIEYNRYGMNNIQPDSLRGYNMMVSNRWGQSEVPFRNRRSTHAFGWMGILLSGEHHDMHWKNHDHISNISYYGTLYDVGIDKHVTIKHPFGTRTDFARIQGEKQVLHRKDPITGSVWNHTHVGDYIEHFNGEDRGDNLFTTSDLPLTYHIDSIDNSLTYIAARDTSPNRFYDVNYSFTVYKCFWPGCTPPTTPPPTTPPVISTLCNWSDPSCWATGQIPTDGENVTIAIDKEVTIDSDIVVDNLYIEGTVRVGNTTDITITARNILINTGQGLASSSRASVLIENGNFFAGSESDPWSCTNTLTINMYGDRFQPEYGSPYGTVPLGGKTIGVMGGLQLFGCPQPIHYALLQTRIQQGDSTMSLDTNVSSAWRIGDELAIAPTSYDGREAERVTITAVSGSLITFTPAVNFTHTGIADTQGEYGHMGAEVSHLTRNIKINGYQDSEDLFGGRIVVVKSDDESAYRRGWAQIDNVEFLHMGQFGHTKELDLRTPVAFYHLGLQIASDPQRSFISNSAIHDSYNGGITIGGGMDGMNVTGNVIFNCVGDAIVVHGENAAIADNIITMVVYRLLYQNEYVSMLLGNAEPENVNLPAGVNTLGSFTATVRDNRVAGGDGPAYKGHGELCTSKELCQGGGSTGPATTTYNNVGHSTVRGYSIVKEASRPCSKFSGFYFWRILDFGIYTQALGSEIYIRDNIFADTVVAVCNIVVGNGGIMHHEHGRMMLSLDNNMVVGRSDHHSCADYDIRDNALIITSRMTDMNRAWWNVEGGHTGFYMPFFAEKETKFPKKPLHSHRQATYNSPNGRSCANGNLFVNFNTDFLCSSRQAVAITSNPETNDHTHMFEIQNTAFNNTSHDHKLYMHRPRRGDVTLAECVDLACDGPKKTFIKDLDGTFSGNGVETSIFGQSEYQWEGVSGFDWSSDVNPTWGLGDFRVPESMTTATNGTVTPMEEYAPNKGVSMGDSCVWNNNWLAYNCQGSQRGHLMFESLDFDTEVRRVAPIGLRSSSGYIDLVNGPADHTCCAGYACSLRATMNYFIVECGETYDFHTSGTMPTKVMFSLHHMPPTCKVRIQMYTMRQNRQDVYLNGENIIYSNQYDFANDTWMFPDKRFIPEITDSSGSNYYDRADQILYFVLGGSDQAQVRIANSIILTLDIVTELTPEEFYASENLPYLLAALLGLNPSQVKIIEVIRESSGAAQRRWKNKNTFVSKPQLKDKSTIKVNIELSNDPDYGQGYDGNSGSTVRRGGDYPSFDSQHTGNTIVALQMEGKLDNLIQENAGQGAEVIASSLTSSAIAGDVPRWYKPGTDAEDQTILGQLGIDPDTLDEADNATALIYAAAEALNITHILNSTNENDQEELQTIIDKTTEAVQYTSKPTTMVIVQQIPQKIFVGSYMQFPIKVAMLDSEGFSMTEVGFNGDPMRVTAITNTVLENAETKFTPGSGVATFGTMIFNEPGRYNLIITLTYTALANVTVQAVTSISFEVTADIPDHIEISQQPESSALQKLPLSPVHIIMFDSNGNQMTGDIITASDPWRVCASLVTTEISSPILHGDTEVPFRNGLVTFSDLTVENRAKQAQLRFDLCYAGNSDLSSLAFSPVFSEPFDIVNVNECFENIHQCSVNANCTDTAGSYDCECHAGFVGNGFICMDQINECVDGIHKCDANAVCADAPVGYTCACILGFGGDGFTCSDIDECSDQTHFCNPNYSNCINTNGDFNCQCHEGYQNVADDKICRDIDECLDSQICGPNQSCNNVDGSFFCTCGSGFEIGTSGDCVDLNECADGSNYCGKDTDCINTNGAYVCEGTGGGGDDDQCENIQCTDGTECVDGTCIDINECNDPTLNYCQSFETCENNNGGFSCTFDYNENCPNVNYDVEWKGAKFTKIMMQSATSVVAMINVNRMGGYDIRRNTYLGFLAYSRKTCGTDFMKAVLDGRLSISFDDTHVIYEPLGKFVRVEGSKSSVGFSYRLTEVVDEDMPWRKTKTGIKKNMKKDQVFIVIDGIDTVTWKSNMEDCITKGAIGVLPDGEYPESLTACVIKDKNFV